MVQPAQPAVYLITGASRGLGLEMVTQLLGQHDTVVIAAARQPNKSETLLSLSKQHGSTGRLHVVPLDITNEDSIKEAANWTDQHVGRVDVLVNNAGISDSKMVPWYETDFKDAAKVLTTNVVAPLMVSTAFLPLIRKGSRKVIANVSSSLGSLSSKMSALHAAVNEALKSPGRKEGAQCTSGDFGIAYSASKSALNMETLYMATDLAAEGITVISLCPGWAQTDMGHAFGNQVGVTPPITAEQSINGVLNVLEKVTLKDAGKFLTYEGKEVPW